jgi:hypothetical protein
MNYRQNLSLVFCEPQRTRPRGLRFGLSWTPQCRLKIRLWRGLEIHVGQHRTKDGHWTSVWRLTEDGPERPTAPLVWEPPLHGISLRLFGAIQSIDRLYLWNIGNVMKTQGIDWRLLKKLWHEDISELLRRVFFLTCFLFRQVCYEKGVIGGEIHTGQQEETKLCLFCFLSRGGGCELWTWRRSRQGTDPWLST